MATNETVTGERRRLADKRAAAVLVAAMLAVPGIPLFLQLASDESYVAAAGDRTEMATDAGLIVTASPPQGWKVELGPGSVTWRSGEAEVSIKAYDLGDRDVDAVGRRLLRLDRANGYSAAYDGGQAKSGDGSLSGHTCVVTTDELTGTCAVVADDDVVVFVQSLGDADHAAVPLDDVLGSMGRTDG